MVKQTRFFKEITCDHGLVRSHPTDSGRCRGGEVEDITDQLCDHGHSTAHDWPITVGPGNMTMTFQCEGPDAD